MQLNITRHKAEGAFAWGLIDGAFAHIVDASPTTSGFFRGIGNRLRFEGFHPNLACTKFPLEGLEIVSPITSNQKLIAQALNYGDRAQDVGIEPTSLKRNLFFRKASSALNGPHDAICMPKHIRLLDYEAELGLVICREILGPIEVTDANLHEFVAGLVIVNDVSARDV